jgi:hypothetical protein
VERSRYVSALVRVEEKNRAVVEAKTELVERQAELREALREARDEGASYAELGRIIGVGRERVRRMVAED